MARKIRFPLIMSNGADVRTLEELRENFDLKSILGYFENGKLETWLKDRYYDDIANAVSELSIDDIDLNEKISNIFEISYKKAVDDVDIDTLKRRNEKLEMLRKIQLNNNGSILIKFMKKEYIPSFRQGKLYMNKLKYYIDYENNEVIGMGDKNEGQVPIASKIEVIGNAVIKKTLYVSYGLENNPVFCLMQMKPYCSNGLVGQYRFKDEQQYKQMKDFSEDCVVIYDVDSFLKRFLNACTKEIMTAWHSSVYYNQEDIINNKLLKIISNQQYKSIFQKNPIFEYQQEYRLWINKNIDDPMVLDIGDISDITTVCKADDFFK